VSLPEWQEEAVAKHHDRKSFDCGDVDLNNYLAKHARQAHEAGGAKTYVAVATASSQTVLGYYTLAPGALAYAETPETVRRGLARHVAPVFRLARLATQLGLRGQGLSGQLLLAAGERCLLAAHSVGGVGLLIDAKGERAAAWYESYGAIRLEDRPLSLILPFATVAAAFKADETGQQ